MKIKIGIDLSLMRYGNLQNETPMNILFSAIDFKTMTLNYNHSSSGNKLIMVVETDNRKKYHRIQNMTCRRFT